MKIHREGYRLIAASALVWALIAAALLFCSHTACWIAAGAGVLATGFTARFFRVPERPPLRDENAVYAPADGTVVILEPTEVEEYLGERRIQISIFMSIWNVHVNWFPVGGTVVYTKHHPGKHLVAWHPKSSVHNEHVTTAVDTGRGIVLFRQIAGLVARRIVSYAKTGGLVEQNSCCGVIKFGSRVDIFLPENARICIEKGQKTVGTQTILARLDPAQKA